MWRNRFGRGFGPVVWQITDDDYMLQRHFHLPWMLDHWTECYIKDVLAGLEETGYNFSLVHNISQQLKTSLFGTANNRHALSYTLCENNNNIERKLCSCSDADTLFSPKRATFDLLNGVPEVSLLLPYDRQDPITLWRKFISHKDEILRKISLFCTLHHENWLDRPGFNSWNRKKFFSSPKSRPAYGSTQCPTSFFCWVKRLGRETNYSSQPSSEFKNERS